MSDQDNVLYDDDGTPLGLVYVAEDGALVATDLDGHIVGATTPDGTPLDPSGYTFADDDGSADPVDGRLAALEQQIAAFEQQRHADAYQASNPLDDPAAFEELGRDIQRQAQGLEQQLGYKLTHAEHAKLAEVVEHHMLAGRDVDVIAAYEQATHEGTIKPYDNMKHHDRVERMTTMLNESNNRAAGLEPHGPGAPSHESYDLNNGEERRAWMHDRMTGALPEDHAHDAAYTGDNQEAA